jgi:hypothetical protein
MGPLRGHKQIDINRIGSRRTTTYSAHSQGLSSAAPFSAEKYPQAFRTKEKQNMQVTKPITHHREKYPTSLLSETPHPPIIWVILRTSPYRNTRLVFITDTMRRLCTDPHILPL